MARRWPPPFYETQSEVGLPHERQFTIACHVSTYNEIGNLFIFLLSFVLIKKLNCNVIEYWSNIG